MKHTEIAECMKKILIVFAAIIFGLAVVVKVNAAENGIYKMPNLTNRLENKATRSAINQTQRLERIKKEADRLINNRITSLDNLLARINQDSRLSADEKTSLTSSIQSEIGGLNALKTKIDADTDVDIAKTDAKTIITNYYIYRMFVPKIRILLTIDNLQTLSNNLAGTSTSIQNLINTLKGEGKDTITLQNLLDNVNSQLSTINTTLSSDRTKIESISTTSDFQTILVAVKQDLAGVRNDFAKIRNDIAQMRVDFKGIIKIKTTTPIPTQ